MIVHHCEFVRSLNTYLIRHIDIFPHQTSRKSAAGVDRVRYLARIRSVERIPREYIIDHYLCKSYRKGLPFIRIKIQILRAACALEVRMCKEAVEPCTEPRVLRELERPVMLQDVRSAE